MSCFSKIKENERSLIDNESTIIDLKRETQALSTRVTTLEQSVARKSEQIVQLDTENNSLKSTITEVISHKLNKKCFEPNLRLQIL